MPYNIIRPRQPREPYVDPRRNHHRIDEPLPLRERLAEEMAARRAKPNPQGRPSAAESPALAALRRDLRRASGAERERIATAIRNLEACYRPPEAAPIASAAPKAPRKRRADYMAPGTIRAYAAELLKAVDHRDADGRAIGFTHSEIIRRILARFPVTPSGRNKGKPTRFGVSELKRIRAELAANGATLPYRMRERSKAPRKPAGEPAARLVCDNGKPTPANGYTFHGRMCTACGGTLRYRSKGQCVACHKRPGAKTAA